MLVEQTRQRADVLGAEHGGDPRGALGDPLTVELGHATAHGDLQVRIAAGQFRPQTDRAVHTFRRVLAHGAGVEHDQIHILVGHLLFGGRHIAVLFQHTGDAFGIVHVHLATERVDRVHALAALPRRDTRVGGVRLLRGALRLGHHRFIHETPC